MCLDETVTKTGLAISMPPGCYGRIAPRSGLAIKEFIDVGVGVIDCAYRGEIGAILFNFLKRNFVLMWEIELHKLFLKK